MRWAVGGGQLPGAGDTPPPPSPVPVPAPPGAGGEERGGAAVMQFPRNPAPV